MQIRANTSLFAEFKTLDMSLSGLIIMAGVATLHVTSASIDLLEAAQATTLGPQNLIQLSDIIIGSALALVPVMRARMRGFRCIPLADARR